MLRDIYYENFDGKCYVNVRIMKTSPLYGVSSDILPLFLGGKVKIFSSNQPKNAPPSIAMDKTFFEKWKLSEENKSASKSTKWYFSFTCNDRFEADKVIDQIHELEGMESEERNFLLFNTQLLYIHTHTNDDYLRAVSEMTVSLDMDSSQTSKFAMKLICPDKKKRTLNKLFGKSQYENFAVKLLASDSSEVIVTMKKGKFLWSYLKYTNQFGKVIERER